MNKRIPFILGFILLVIAIWLQITPIKFIVHLLSRLEHLAYDMELRAKLLTHKETIKSPIVIVDIDDKSLRMEGRWPWPRKKIADLVDQIRYEGAAVIAFDVVFSEPEANIADEVLKQLKKENLAGANTEASIKKIKPSFEGDAILANSISHIDTILGMSFIHHSQVEGKLLPPLLKLNPSQSKNIGFISVPGVITNIPLLQSSAKSEGFINVFPDDDGIVRRVPVLLYYKNGLYPSIALEAVRIYLLTKIRLITEDYDNTLHIEGIKIGKDTIPTDEKGQVLIPFQGKGFSFPYYSATDILHNHISHHALEGKIVFIGTSATGLSDLKPTAIQNIFPGVEIQATIAEGILSNEFSYEPAWTFGFEIFLTCFLGIIFTFLFPYLGPRFLALFILLTPFVMIFSNNLLWEKTGLIISIFVPMALCMILAIVNMVYGYLFETRKREQIKEMFGQYVPKRHIDEMLARKSEYGLLGDDREMTVLFADIRNFTTISEPLSAAELKEMLNDFFTPMTEIIFKYRGTIDKYVGDMIMAFWGAPLKDKHHAHHAISAALDMQAMVEKLKANFITKGWPEVNIGIGLNTGNMSVGDMGSKFRRNYTVIGDAVNLGSRVESLTKYYGVKILVSEFTEKNQNNFIFRKIDRVKVKGKQAGIEIYEVLERKKFLTPLLEKELNQYHTALQYYFNQQFETAYLSFLDLAHTHPKTKLYKIYLNRIEEFRKNPPPSDWNGVYIHTAK